MRYWIFLIQLSILIISPLLTSGGLCQDKMEGSVRFAIIGDRTGGHIPGYHGSMLEEIERLKPDFVMTVGDMIEGYSQDTSQIIREWEEYLDLVKVLTFLIHTPCVNTNKISQ